jgi:hypothetical protein
LLVELDIFSGRPNPRWELDDAGADELRVLVARLAPANEALCSPMRMGAREPAGATSSGRT